MAHLHKDEDASQEGVHWNCAQCGWESSHMYFGEVFEPEHLCPNDTCECGHRRPEHRNGTCAGGEFRSEEGNPDPRQGLCGCIGFQPK